MLKRNSQFTLIELIVVIVVLGILAAIVIPNISSFSKEARETQYTADARNIQTGYDMFTAKSPDLEEEAVDLSKTVLATHTLDEAYDKDNASSSKYRTIQAGKEKHVLTAGGTPYADATALDAAKVAGTDSSQRLALVDFGKLHPDFLRKVPKYVDENPTITAEKPMFADAKKKPVAVAVLLDVNNKSTSVVQFVTVDKVGADEKVIVIR